MKKWMFSGDLHIKTFLVLAISLFVSFLCGPSVSLILTQREIENATIQVRGIVESKQLAGYASMPDRFVNLLVWRLGQLIVIIFVLALVYRAAIVRMTGKKDTKAGASQCS